MTINHLRKALPNIKDITVINRSFTYQGQTLVFAFIGKENNNTVAWIVGERLEGNDTLLHKKPKRIKSNRQAINKSFENEGLGFISLEKAEIQGYELKVSEASTDTFGNQDPISFVQYMWMIYNGCDLAQLEHIPTDKLYLVKHTFTEDTQLPKIKKQEPLQIKLTFNKSFEQVKAQKSICVKMGECAGKKYRFTDKQTAEEQVLYIDRLIHVDMWEDAKTKFDQPRYKENFSQQQIEEMKQNYLEHLPDMCPEGMDLAILEYETENEIILDIYTSEFLEKEVEYRSSGLAMIARSDSEPLKGHRVRACVLGPIEKDFDGKMKVEILGYQREIPEEVIFI